MFRYSFESLGESFPRPLTPHSNRLKAPFGKTWAQVLDDLERETRMLHARAGSVTLLTAHTEWDLRKDGTLRSDARPPQHPGVIVKFEAWNEKTRRYDVMTFDCDRFTNYKSNVQAIAGAMEALRKVDRYGVGNAGRDQYAGFKALPSAEGKLTTVEESAAFIATHSGESRHEIAAKPEVLTTAYRKAALKLHPDQPDGDHGLFSQLTEARKIVENHLGI